MKTIGQVCKPRASVFEQRGKDTVYNIDDLDQIEPTVFFAENWVTDGMKVLLSEAFKRLEGKGGSAAGTFLLSQSMGGGKTHNLVALGLLAKHPAIREQVMSSFYKPGDLGEVRVVTFSGRKNTEFGIWGEIAEQLGKQTVFEKLYSPLQPPDDGDWIELLSGEPLLIMLDELPPYFKAAAGVAVGATHLDELTTRALANLIVAVNGGKLPNVCVVLTDLKGTAYQSNALSDLQKEIKLPDTLEDVWVAVAEHDEERAKQKIDEVPEAHPFSVKYDRIEPVDWESCSQVLDTQPQLEMLRTAWR